MIDKPTTSQLEIFTLEDDPANDAAAQTTVQCLGMTFGSEDERRAYFRRRLRERLPELRRIAGFPVATDDDIVRLSDPPYYTACPNPWLEELIRQWEEEKKRLEASGQRTADMTAAEPYAADVSEGKSNPVYTAHTYHTKVPHPAIMRYLLHYTQPGDIVLDGFAGTGMTGVAAAACGRRDDETAKRITAEWERTFGCKPQWGIRHAITGDLSPYAVNIASFYNTPVDVQRLTAEVERIQREMEEECLWMYKTTDSGGRPTGRISFTVWSDILVCPVCGGEYVFWHQAVDHAQKKMLDEFECPHCHALQSKRTAQTATETYYDEALRRTMQRVKSVPVIVVARAGREKIQRAPNEYDLAVLKRIDETAVEDFYPTMELPDGYNTEQPKRSRHIYHVHQFYTRRNLIALSKLYAKIEASPMAHALRFLFTGMINRSTNRNRVHVNYYFNGGGGWNGGELKGTLYVSSAPTETSVIDLIANRKSAMLSTFRLLPSAHISAQYVSSADALTLADDTIDYIFTDPPFGANLNYSELNSLPEPWLRVVTDNTTEAIENRGQGKSAQHYHDTMTRCFREYHRVLKPGRWMTVEFSNTSAAVWNSLQLSLSQAGFVVAGVAALDKKQGSFKAVTTTTAVKQDLVISCYKPTAEIAAETCGAITRKESLWNFVEELLRHLPVHLRRDNKTTTVVERSPKILYDRTIAYYVQHGYAVPIDAGDFQRGLRERFVERDGMMFTDEQALEYERKRAQTVAVEAGQSLFVGSEAEGIEWLRRELATPQTYQDLQPKWMPLMNPKKGERLPELKDILEENFLHDEDGRYRLPDPAKEADLERLRYRALAREFRTYVEMAGITRGRIKEARLEALRYGFAECYKAKEFQTIVSVASRLPESLVMEDEVLLQYYDIAQSRI